MRVVEYLEPVGSGGRHAAVDLVGADMRRVDVLGRTAARDDRPANTRTDLVATALTSVTIRPRSTHLAFFLGWVKRLGRHCGRSIGRVPQHHIRLRSLVVVMCSDAAGSAAERRPKSDLENYSDQTDLETWPLVLAFG